MRIAVFSDIHGNVAALEAVLADARARGVDAYWCLGDLVAYGPRPIEVVEAVRALRNLLCVRGNTDRYTLTGDVRAMIPPIDDPQTPHERRVLADVHESFAWTRSRLAEAGQCEWLGRRPLEERHVLEDGTRVLLAHAAPGADDGWGLHPDRTDSELASLGFVNATADLFLVGHTHLATDRNLDGCRAVNPGPVSLSRMPTTQALWALLDATERGYQVTWHAVDYAVDAVVADLHRRDHPAARWIATKLLDAREGH